MKPVLFAILMLGLAPLTLAEDSVSCADGVSVAWTDKSTISAEGLGANQRLLGLRILQQNDLGYTTIKNNETLIDKSPLLKVELFVDNGTSLRSLLIFDWSQFSDVGIVPVESYDQDPSGKLRFKERVQCEASQS